MSAINAESGNLAPALERLVSTDVRIVSGKYRDPFSSLFSWILNALIGIIGNHLDVSSRLTVLLPGLWAKNIPLPEGMKSWTKDAAPYITNIRQTNLGVANDGLPGDILMGYFRPLHEDFDGPEYAGEQYFMIVNSTAFQNATSEETSQQIEIRFDFSGTNITSLQRLNRVSGEVEEVFPKPEGKGKYLLDLRYGGGEGDLFKFNTGAPFVASNIPDGN